MGYFLSTCASVFLLGRGRGGGLNMEVLLKIKFLYYMEFDDNPLKDLY